MGAPALVLVEEQVRAWRGAVGVRLHDCAGRVRVGAAVVLGTLARCSAMQRRWGRQAAESWRAKETGLQALGW